MEFLMGRALGNNIINLGEQKEIREALEELGFDLNAIEDQEPDPALGNGGLSRPALAFWILLLRLIPGLWLRYPLPLRHVQAEN